MPHTILLIRRDFRRGIPTKIRFFSSDERGTSAVELALLLPVIILIAMGVADYSRVLTTSITLASAAKTGAQFGAQNTAKSGDTAAMNTAARQDGAEAGTITATSARTCRCETGTVVNCITGSCGAYGAPGVYVAVTATRAVTMLFKYPGMRSTINVSRTATLRVQ